MKRILCAILLVVFMSTKIASLYAEISADTTKLQTGLKQTKTGLDDLKGTFKAVAGYAAIATTAFLAVKAGLDATVGSFVKYANEVRTLSQVTGASATQTSRLIQLADDHKVSVQNLTTAMRTMSTQGNAVTTDSLARMSDAYLKLNPGIERQQYLMKNFGRAGVEFAELMMQGGNAIRSQSDAINENLVLSEEAVRQAREYEMAVDELKDTQQALAITIGQRLTPAMINLTNATNGYILAQDEMAQYEINSHAAARDRAQDLDSATRSYMAMAGAIEAAANATAGLSEASQEFQAIAAGTNSSLAGLAAQAMITQLSLDGAFTYDDARRVLDYRMAVDDLTQSEYEAQVAALNLAQALASMPAEKAININVNYLYHGSSYNMEQAVGLDGIQEKASGGPAKGFFIAGDPGAHEELIYAPGGAYVYNAAQTRAMKSRGRFPHYSLGNLPMEDQSIGKMTSKNPVAASSYNPFTGVTYTEHGWSDPSGTTMMPGVTTYSTPQSGGGSSAIQDAIQASSSAVQSVSQAATQIASSGEETANATKENTQMQATSSAESNGLLRSIDTNISRLRKDILRGFRDSVEQIQQ